MKFCEVFTDLRKKAGFSQNQVSDELHVTRQAVSRWERGETVPEVETLQALSAAKGLSFPLGRDPARLARLLRIASIPALALVARFGRLVHVETSAPEDTAHYEALLAPFLGEDYTETVVLSPDEAKEKEEV